MKRPSRTPGDSRLWFDRWGLKHRRDGPAYEHKSGYRPRITNGGEDEPCRNGRTKKMRINMMDVPGFAGVCSHESRPGEWRVDPREHNAGADEAGFPTRDQAVEAWRESHTILQAIIDQKHEAGEDAYLWMHCSGDVILWPNEQSSENDDGAHAIARWTVGAETVEDLIDSGEVDDVE